MVPTSQDGLNETTKCECFGINAFEGDKCEIKSAKTVQRENTIKATVLIAILSVILFYSLIFSMDLHKFLTKKSAPINNKNKKEKKMNRKIK